MVQLLNSIYLGASTPDDYGKAAGVVELLPFYYYLGAAVPSHGKPTVNVLLSGVSPLTLVNAVKLNYVKAFGKCEQDLTPTPASPVDIVCNNGAIKAKDDELPVGYNRVTQINFDGDSYYETNQTLFGSDTLTIRIGNTVSAGRNIIGAYSGTGDEARNFSLFIYGAGSTSNSYFRHGTNIGRPRYGTGARTLVMSPTGTDGFLTDVTYPQETFETTSTCWIGGLPNSSSPKFDGTIIGNITVSDRLKYIPCERASDGAIGYYETANGDFLTNGGSGNVTKGAYDNSHLVAYIDVTDQETISVDTTGSSATCQNLLSAGSYKDVQNVINGQVTHNVGVLVLTGAESWNLAGSGDALRVDIRTDIGLPPTQDLTSPMMCTHYPFDAYFSTGGSTQPGTFNAWNGTEGYFLRFSIVGMNITTVDQWKNWLVAQAAAGTPVVVIYPLATPTTETVAGQTLTITQGTNVVTAEGSVDDLELEISYKGYAELIVEEIEAVNTDESVEVTIS